MGEGSVDEAARAWAEVRPAPRCRTPDEVAEGIAWARASEDMRLQTFAAGAGWALRWVLGETPVAPLLEVPMPIPNMREISEVSVLAGRVAAGLWIEIEAGATDVTRLYARGVEECLFWWSTPRYPRPVWTIAGIHDAVLVDLAIGTVGADPATASSRVSAGRFPYDPVDRQWGRPGE